MTNDFFVDGAGSGEFGVRLLADYKVGGTPLTRSRLKSTGVQGWVPLATQYGLRPITLPIYLAADSPQKAALMKSQLDAAFLPDSVELELPNGMTYTASLESSGEVTEVTLDGREITWTYGLVGYAHDPLVAFTVNSDGSFDVTGTAPEMACRLTCTVGAAAASYLMAGVTWTDVSVGDVLVLDGIEKRVLCNGINAFGKTDLITWPTLHPKNNVLTAPDTIAIEYYPIWL